MALDLETLRTEIQAYLDESGAAVFHGYHRMIDTLNQVSWDTEQHPDFREFLIAGLHARGEAQLRDSAPATAGL